MDGGAWARAAPAPVASLPAVLAYHKVGTPECGGTWCTVRQFRAHLEALSRAGWHPISAGDFAARLARGGGRAAVPAGPARSFLLTFDDAFASFADHAWPELERRGWPTLLFVITDYVGRRSTWDLPLPGRRVLHLDWRALGDLARRGVEIGTHGATHRDLRRLDQRTLERELVGSRRAAEDALGIPVTAIAYPFGRVDARVREATAAAGYTLGFSLCLPRHFGRDDPLALPRQGVYVTDGGSAVLDKIDPSRPLHPLQGLALRAINGCAALAARRGGVAEIP